MNFQAMRMYLYGNAPAIGTLAKAGDKLAIAVYRAYQAWHADKLDPAKQAELLKLVNEYVVRNCTLTEIDELERKYGAPHPDSPIY